MTMNRFVPLLAVLMLALLPACDSSVETDEGVFDDTRDAANGADTLPTDTRTSLDTSASGDAVAPSHDTIGTDAAAHDQADATSPDAAGMVCHDCMCQCSDGRYIPYGGCFGPNDEIPTEILNCSADCGAACAVQCPDIDCLGVWCPSGYWTDADACSTCACEPPPVRLEVNGESRNAAYVGLQTTPSLFIGGLDRLVFDLVWTSDHPDWADDEETLSTTVRLVTMDWHPGPDMSTFYMPSETSSVLEVFPVTFTQFGVAVVEYPLVVDRAMVSVRREGDRLIGGVHLQLIPSTGNWPTTVVAAGSFDVPMPI